MEIEEAKKWLVAEMENHKYWLEDEVFTDDYTLYIAYKTLLPYIDTLERTVIDRNNDLEKALNKVSEIRKRVDEI